MTRDNIVVFHLVHAAGLDSTTMELADFAAGLGGDPRRAVGALELAERRPTR